MSRLRLLNFNDFENIYMNYIHDETAFSYEELKRRHAENRNDYRERLVKSLGDEDEPMTEAQQLAVSRLLAGKGGDR